jgi:hypothetical protein
MSPGRSATLLSLLVIPVLRQVQAQAVSPGQGGFSRRNSFGVFSEYSNDSSHILLGQARNRKLFTVGGSYSRRLLSRPSLDLNYLLEVRPVLVESDPLVRTASTYTSAGQTSTNSFNSTQASVCHPTTTTYTGTFLGTSPPETYTDVVVLTCGQREWTFGEGLSPLGLRLNLRPERRIQPVFTLLGGYMFSTHPIPVSNAGSANYTLAFGAGIELFHSAPDTSSIFGHRSLRLEYRYSHISNAYSAQQNPGIDNGLFQITYAFGR